MCCSDKGIVYSARAYKIPECTRTAAGTPLVQVLITYLVFIEYFWSLLISIWMSDLVLVRWRKNNLNHPCEWVCWWPIFGNAHSQWVHQESITELFLINKINRNNSYTIGQSSLMHFLRVVLLKIFTFHLSNNSVWFAFLPHMQFDRFQMMSWNGYDVAQMMTLLQWLPKMEWSFLPLVIM